MTFNQYARNENENAKFTETSAGNVAVRVVGSSGSTSLDVTTNSSEVGGYIGKPTGQNGDFVTAYLAATTITLSSLPSDVTAFYDEDIVSVEQYATGGTLTRRWTRDDSAMSITTNVLTVSSAAFVNSDTFVIYTSVPRPSGGGGASVDAEYRSPSDFTATFTNSTTITLAGVPFTPLSEELVYIKVIPASGDTSTYVAGSSGVSLTISAGVITIAGAGTPFTAGDAYEVGINSQQKAYDSDLDTNKSIEQSPTWARRTDAEAIISAAQELDASFTDLGPEIDMSGYNNLGVWLTVDIGTSTNVQLRILHKHESAGAEEYREIYLGSPSSNLTTINLNDYEVGTDSDQLFKINIPVSATSPIIQLQVKDDADGDGQIDAAYITKAWSS